MKPRHFNTFALSSLLFVLSCLLTGPATHAQTRPTTPVEFIDRVVNNTLNTIRDDPSIKIGDLARITQVVDAFIINYVDFKKATRLAAGRYWKDASPSQQEALAVAFRSTLLRTYAGAFTRIESNTAMKMLPFRGDPGADDVVVRTQLFRRPTSDPTILDYRLEKTADSWRIYDINVENIWLIENYRNQFSQQINQNGIDGLIEALNQRNQKQ
jgi:phospholipid transport system substrate-binding protein